MLILSVQGASAPTESIADFCSLLPSDPDYYGQGEYETVRHMLFGTMSAVRSTIRLLHRLNYAKPNDWSQPISTGRPNEVMAILTKRLRVS